MLQTTDPKSATAFYGEVFGWREESFGAAGTEVTLCRLPRYVGGEPQQPVPRDVIAAMMPIAGAGETRSQWSVDFWVDDADASAERAKQLGGSVIVAPQDVPSFRRAVLADPQGAEFSISQITARP